MMSEIQRIRGRCRIDSITGCWEFRGARTDGKYPRIWTMDYTLGGMRSQTGTRAVWHAFTGKPIPAGHRVYHCGCSNNLCVNPLHLACGTTEQWGQKVADSDIWKNQTTRIQANRATGRKRSSINRETAREISTSTESGVAIAARLGVLPSIISKVRTGKLMAVLQMGNPFAGLIGARE